MGQFQAVPAVTSEYTSLEDSLESGRSIVAMFEQLGLLHHDAVALEIGCGIGRIEYHLYKRVKFCYGVDISPSMIQKARANVSAPNVKFLCTDGVGLAEFGDSAIDLIYSIFVFQHLPRDIVDIYAQDSFRKLVPGGRFVFQMMVDDSRLLPEPPATHPYGLRYYTRSEVRCLLDTAGFGQATIYDFKSWEPDPGTRAGDLLFVATKP